MNLGSRISGTVVHLPVMIGDGVEAGQLLAGTGLPTVEIGLPVPEILRTGTE